MAIVTRVNNGILKTYARARTVLKEAKVGIV